MRALRPDAEAVRVQPEQGERRSSSSASTARACREALLPKARLPLGYGLEVDVPGRDDGRARDPYSFLPTLGELDLHLAREGRHEQLYEQLGAHVREVDGVAGTAFAVWAPTARSVSVVGDFNGWDGRLHPMRSLGASGIWELFVPGVAEGAQLQVRDPRRRRRACA